MGVVFGGGKTNTADMNAKVALIASGLGSTNDTPHHSGAWKGWKVNNARLL